MYTHRQTHRHKHTNKHTDTHTHTHRYTHAYNMYTICTLQIAITLLFDEIMLDDEGLIKMHGYFLKQPFLDTLYTYIWYQQPLATMGKLSWLASSYSYWEHKSIGSYLFILTY